MQAVGEDQTYQNATNSEYDDVQNCKEYLSRRLCVVAPVQEEPEYAAQSVWGYYQLGHSEIHTILGEGNRLHVNQLAKRATWKCFHQQANSL